MRNKRNKRIVSALLALVLLLTNLPLHAVHAETADGPQKIIGTAKFNPALYDEVYGYTYAYITEDPTRGLNMDISHTLSPEGLFDLEMVVVDTYSDGIGYWYQVAGAEGQALPDALAAMPWVYQNDLGESAYPDTLLVTFTEPDPTEPSAPTEPSTPTEPSKPSEPDEPEIPTVSAPVLGAGGNPLGLTVTVSGDALPEGAQVVASVPAVGGEAASGVYDIKVLKADGTQWQPIDEGKTVTLSIPVPGVADGEYVNVFHIVDHAAAMNGDVQFEDISGASDEIKLFLKDAMAATGMQNVIGVELRKGIQVRDGEIRIQTDSFSIYAYDEVNHEFDLAQDQSGVVKLENWSADDKTYSYFATEGSTFTLVPQFLGLGNYTLVDEYSSGVVITQGQSGWSGNVCTVTLNNVSVGDEIKIQYYKPKNLLRGEDLFYVSITIVRELDITYDANGRTATGMPNPLKKTIATDGTIQVTAPAAPSSNNAVFKGWDTSNAGNGTRYQPGEPFVPSGDMTLYAIWEAETAKVNFDFNDGTDKVTSMTVDRGATVEFPEPQDRGDCQFAGWCAAKAGSGEIYQGGDKITVSSDATYYAIWLTSLSCTISGDIFEIQMMEGDEYSWKNVTGFTSNGSSYVMEAVEGFHKGTTFRIKAAGSSNFNAGLGKAYTSKGANVNFWTEDSGKTLFIQLPDGVTVDTSITVTTEKDQFTVTYMTRGGEPIPAQTVSSGTVINLAEKVTTRQDYTFAGWFTDAELTASASGNVTVTGHMTFYAKWTADGYRITYNLDGGSLPDGVTNPATYTVESETFTLNQPVKEGHTFEGWTGTSLTEAAKEVTIAQGSSGHRRYTAVWTPNDYTYQVAYRSSNGDELGTNTATHAFGTTNTVSAPDFVGYTTPASQTVTWDSTAPKTIVFTYVPVTYTIDFLLDGGAAADGVTYPEKYQVADILTIPDPEKTGYNFAGWTVTTTDAAENWEASYANGEGSLILSNMYGNVQLTATWTPASGIAYYVEHWFTQVTMDGYRKDPVVDTLYGTTGEMTNAISTKRSVEGFPFERVEEKTIAPDGSTVAIMYYGRSTTTITFDTQGGTEVAPISGPHGTVISAPPMPQKLNYTFVGWYTAENPAVNYQFSTLPVRDLTLYARWELTESTVTFLDDDGITPLYVVNGHAGDPFEWPATPHKAGYYFNGWDKAQFTVIPEEPTTVVASWDMIEYVVSYQEKVGSEVRNVPEVTPNPETFTIMDNATANLPAPHREGYAFIGWYPDKECAGEAYIPLALSKELGALATDRTIHKSLYAKWEPNRYYVRFDVNGGHGTMVDQSFTYGAAQPLKNNDFHKLGYTFAGWNTAADGSGKAYGNGEQVNNLTTAANETVTLYAQWTPNTYTVRFDANKGTGTMAEQTFTYDVTEKLTANAFAKIGYTFVGWNTAADGSGDGYEDKAQVGNLTDVLNGAVTLYAQWKANSYTVRFDANEGVGSMPDQIFTYDVPEKLEANTFTRIGYTFTGWNTKADGSGAAYADEAELINVTQTADEILVLYAQYQLNYYTVTGVIAQGTVNGPVTVDYHTPAELSFSPNLGYFMTAWWDNAGGTGVFNSTERFGWTKQYQNLTRDITVTVATAPVAYAITYLGIDGAEVDPANPDAYTIESGTITLTNPTRPGYTFAGWTGTGIDGVSKNVTIAAGSTGDRAYTATWTINQYTITFDTDGGSLIDPITRDYGTAVEAPADPTKTGYTFAGWDVEIPTVMPGENITVKAKWTVNQYTVTWNVDGSLTQVLCDYGANIPAPAVPAKPGYTFTGWDGYTSGMSMPANDVTFTAQWTPAEYTITYHLGVADPTVSPANPESYTIESPEITLTNPTKQGYVFEGWTGTGIDGKAESVTIAPGSMGNRVYTAAWSTTFHGAIICEDDDAAGTIAWNDDPDTTFNSPLYLSGEDAMVGAYKGRTLTFKPNTGYQIVDVKVNGEKDNSFTESGYTYSFGEDGLTGPVDILVTTEVVPVTVSIVITGSGGESETIEVLEGSDVLIAFTPDGGKINAVTLDYAAGTDNEPAAKTVRLEQGVANGYIFAEHQLKQNVTITIDTTTPRIYTAAGCINAGIVKLAYGSEVVKSTDSADGKALPLETPYTIRVDSDAENGYVIKEITGETVADNLLTFEKTDDKLDAEAVSIVATAQITQFTLTFLNDDGSEYAVIAQNYGTKVTAPDAPEGSTDPQKENYVFDGWVDNPTSNKYLAVPETMPNHDMTFYAKWVDPRLDKSANVFVGINMSFYMTRDNQLYYRLPTNEPAQQHNIWAAHTFFVASDRSTWKIIANNYKNPLPGKPTDYISEAIIQKGRWNGAVFGISAVNSDGTANDTIKNLNLLKLDGDYESIVRAWLNACKNDQSFRDKYSSANIDWQKLPGDASAYEVIPYVIKLHTNHIDNTKKAWYIDMIIVPRNKYSVTYDLGDLKNDTAYTQPQCPEAELEKYGEGFKVKVPSLSDAVRTDDNRYLAKFDGWAASDVSVVISDGGKGTFSMPGKDITLTARWKYPVNYSIEYYKKDPNGSYVLVPADTEAGLIGYVDDTPVISKTYTGYALTSIVDPTVQANNHVIKVYYDPITYTVKFHANNGTAAAAAEQAFTYDVEQALLENQFTKPGFVFVGWAASADGDKLYTDGQTVRNLASEQDAVVSLYAVYEPITLTIAQSGMDGVDSGIYVVLKDDQEVARVMVKGNASVTLEQIPAGTYIVQEISGKWTWKYSPTGERQVLVVAAQENKVTFERSLNQPIDWLNTEKTN